MNSSARLKQICSIFSVSADNTLLNRLSEVLQRMFDEKIAINTVGVKRAARIKADGHLDRWMHEAQVFDEYRKNL